MFSRLVAVAFDAHNPVEPALFWSGMLGREVRHEANGVLLPGDPTQVGLRFVEVSTEGSAADRLHLHLTTTSLEDQQQKIQRALTLGGGHRDVGQLPEDDHVVLADPDGNAFCIIGPGNDFLAGSGPLGEVSCDGRRDVGLFWRDALGWPLVWDRDQETAIQSPAGGTKLSWGGPPIAPKHGRNRQHFDLAADDLIAEVSRLVALGATERGDRNGAVELADPDDNEFRIVPA